MYLLPFQEQQVGAVDHGFVASTIIIPANSLSKTLTIPITMDATTEADETLVLTAGTPTNAKLGTIGTHTLTISEGNVPPAVQWSLTSQQIQETQTSVTLTAVLSSSSGTAISVPYTVTGTAKGAGLDHNLASGTLSIPANTLSQSLTFSAINDTVYESDESIIVTLGTPTGATLGGNSSQTLTIKDDDNQPTVQFQATALNTSEDTASISVALVLIGTSAQEVLVPYSVGGSAQRPADHGLQNGVLIIPALSSSENLTFSIANDALFESDETVVITLGTPINAVAGTNTTATVTIKDNDSAPVVQFSILNQTVGENAGSLSLIVTLSKASIVPVTVSVLVSGTAIANSDYSVPNSTVTIPAMSTQGSTVITILDDGLHESTEAVTFQLSAPTYSVLGTNATHTLSITDNDPLPQVQWQVAAQTASESASNLSAVLYLSKISGVATVVSYAVSGAASVGKDHTLAAGSITIPAGMDKASLSVPILNDSTPEPDDDTIILSISSASKANVGSVVAHVITITDDDATATAGLEAFRYSVYKFTRANCVQCHGETQSPLHAGYDIATAYSAAKPKVNFADIPASIMVERSKNGHCGLPTCMTDGTAMIAAIQTWAAAEGSTPGPTPAPGGDEVPAFQCSSQQQGKAVPQDLRRLSYDEYRNTLKAILGDSIYQGLSVELNQFPFDKITNQISDFQNHLSPNHVTAITNIAYKASELVVAAKATFVGACSTATPVTDTCVKTFLRTFGQKAFRRPLREVTNDNEVNDYYSLYQLGPAPNDGLQLVTMRFLQSPYFLFHVEEGGPVLSANEQNKVNLTQYEIANRIAYMATAFPPDTTLTQAAQSNALTTIAAIKSQVARLLQTTAGQSRMQQFFNFWIQSDRVPTAPQYSATFLNGLSAAGLGAEVLQELTDYVTYMMQNGKGYRELMTSKAVFPRTTRMATIYGSNQWTPGQAPPVTPQARSGLLGRVALLMQNQENVSPILRGVLIRKRLLCDPLPLPNPADIAERANQVQLDPLLYSARERFAELTKPSNCMGCHSQINPLGFAMGHFDALGRWRTQESYYSNGQVAANHTIATDGNALIEPSVSHPITGLDDLSVAIADHRKGSSCYIKQVYEFTRLRPTVTEDSCVLNETRAPLLNSGSLLDAYVSVIGHNQVMSREVLP